MVSSAFASNARITTISTWQPPRLPPWPRRTSTLISLSRRTFWIMSGVLSAVISTRKQKHRPRWRISASSEAYMRTALLWLAILTTTCSPSVTRRSCVNLTVSSVAWMTRIYARKSYCKRTLLTWNRTNFTSRRCSRMPGERWMRR
jgi:hypothetical protein